VRLVSSPVFVATLLDHAFIISGDGKAVVFWKVGSWTLTYPEFAANMTPLVTVTLFIQVDVIARNEWCDDVM